MRVERKGGGKYGRASCCRIGWRRDEGERRAKGWAGRGRSEKRLLNAMEARLSKRGGKLGVSDAVENARRSYAAGLSWGLMESVSSASRNRVAFLSYDQDLYAHECWFCRGDPASFIPRQFRLLWCAMKLYLGYISALQFWRWWSSSHPLALRVFHDMRPGETGHTPSFPVLFVPSLRQCAFRDEDVIDCLRDAGIDVCPAPVHVLVEGSQGARDTPVVKKHRTTVAFPRGSFVKVAPSVLVSSSELLFLQMAKALAFGEMVALGFELCGCYPLSDELSSSLVRSPLTTPSRLSAFVARARNHDGVQLARRAVRHVMAKSASPMETELAALAFISSREGGLGLRRGRLNEPIDFSESIQRACGCRRAVCDILWPEERLILEYDGKRFHGTDDRVSRDARRKDALLLAGYDLVTMTGSRLGNVFQCAELLDQLSARMGKPKKKRGAGHLDRHMRLRKQLRSYHNSFLFRDGKGPDR